MEVSPRNLVVGDTLEGLGWGSRVWIRQGHAWVLGTLASTVEDSKAEAYQVVTEQGTSLKVARSDVAPANPTETESGSDLTALPFVSEPGLLRSLEQRFRGEEVYTSAGPVLVAINPFKPVPHLYDAEGHAAQSELSQDPHIFSVTRRAFEQMRSTGRCQSILISGESGAGKTETTKFAMRYLSLLASGSGMERRVLDSNPLLEAFGNAATLLNANSSRFGKLITIYFSASRAIAGASIQTYLLEKSRVVHRAAGERNFHIFYQLLAGASSQQRQELGFGDIKAEDSLDAFAYVKPMSSGQEMAHNLEEDATAFGEVTMAMAELGIPVDPVLRLLAAILWLGNIQFDSSGPDGSADVCGMVDDTKCAPVQASRLLGVPVESLCAALTRRQLSAGGELVDRRLDVVSAVENRDALSKALYSKLFDWLVTAINKALLVHDVYHSNSTNQSLQQTGSMSILDIYGFESFASGNSFEQLCINYANERLQQQFNEHLFELEQEAYHAEGVEWADIDYADNADCVALLEARPPVATGVFTLLDEECLFPGGTDDSFGHKLRRQAGPHPRLVWDTKAPGTDFSIHHSAGTVTYRCSTMLDKNRDSLSQDIALALAGSSDELVRVLASGLATTEREKRRSAAATTVGARFRDQLRSLVSGLDATQLHFVRCLRPNAHARPHDFDASAVRRQLRCCGVLEIVRLARAGFPTRHTYQNFLELYGPLLVLKNNVRQQQKSSSNLLLSVQQEQCVAILEAFDVSPSQYRLGHTKLFCRAGVLGRLEDHAARVVRAVEVLQRQWRMSIVRRRFLAVRSAVIVLQAHWRGVEARRIAKQLRERQRAAAVTIQAASRGLVARKQLRERRLAAVRIQQAWHKHREMSQYEEEEEDQTSVEARAIIVQGSLGKEEQRSTPRRTRSHLPAAGVDVDENTAIDSSERVLLDEAVAARRSAESDVERLRAELEVLQQKLTEANFDREEESESPTLSPAWPGRSSQQRTTPGTVIPGGLAICTPQYTAAGTPDSVSYNGGGSDVSPTALSSRTPTAVDAAGMAREFERKAALLDDDAAFIGEVHAGLADAPGMDAEVELAALHRRFDRWKSSFKQRLAALDKALKSSKKASGRKPAFLNFGRA